MTEPKLNLDRLAAMASSIRILRHSRRRIRRQIRVAGMHPVKQARVELGMPRKLFSADQVLNALEQLTA